MIWDVSTWGWKISKVSAQTHRLFPTPEFLHMLLIIPLPAACLNACLWFCTHHHSEQPHSKQKQHTVLFSQFSSHFGYSLFLVYCFWLDRWSTSKFLLNETELFSRSILVKMELLLRISKSGLGQACEGDRGKVSWRILPAWLSYSADTQNIVTHLP